MTKATQLENGKARNQTQEVRFQILSLNFFIAAVESTTFWQLSVTSSGNLGEI